ncbi:hypothetical protein MYG64_07315 [Ensifer adhaerens]|uniref:hypothetical protein n=1 Tax=Ensifer adhaerens TaxID=106592 RepID=UPI0021008BFE|nr:hypothetical protein [Ensifer adhaerens]UTV38094.1 hypothetical protein MYG64_07315 [Ensifer adhaerens]
MRAVVWSLIGAVAGASVAHAENTFGTAEVTVTDSDATSIMAVGATSKLEAVNNTYVIGGTFVRASDGVQTPIEVHVPQSVTTDMAFATAQEMGIDIKQRITAQFQAGEIKINKAVYSVSGERSGSIVMTDDPIPIIAYVLIAGVALVIGTETASAVICEGDYKRTYEIKPLEGTFKLDSECVKK